MIVMIIGAAAASSQKKQKEIKQQEMIIQEQQAIINAQQQQAAIAAASAHSHYHVIQVFVPHGIYPGSKFIFMVVISHPTMTSLIFYSTCNSGIQSNCEWCYI